MTLEKSIKNVIYFHNPKYAQKLADAMPGINSIHPVKLTTGLPLWLIVTHNKDGDIIYYATHEDIKKWGT